MAKITADINIPLQVGPLKYDKGKECKPHPEYGRSWMYGTENDDTFYADEKCQAAIEASGVRLGKGASFTVLKSKESDGKTNKYTITGAGGAPDQYSGYKGDLSQSGRQAAPRAAGSLTFADVSFAYRECLFAARAHQDELASLTPDGPKPTFETYQAGAATMGIWCDKAGCTPRAPKAAPKLDGEHTKAFLSWLGEYRGRPEIAELWPSGKAEIASFLVQSAGKATMQEVAEANDPVMYETIKTLLLAETANRAEARKSQPMEEGQAEIPF